MAKIKIIENSRLPRLFKVYAITLYPFIFLQSTKKEARQIYALQHEFVHISQIQEFGVLRFYIQYILEYLKNLIKYKNHIEAYLSISFEKEAYATQEIKRLPWYAKD